jgi:hypothetical protein
LSWTLVRVCAQTVSGRSAADKCNICTGSPFSARV